MVHYAQYQYFLFYILLIWGVHTHPTNPPCPRACHMWQSPGLDSLTTERITNARRLVVIHLAKLFNLIVKHSYVPNAFGEAVVVRLIRDKNCAVCSSDN